MHLLDNPPRHLLLTGKGGVGKTSIACAVAVRLARSGRSVLLVSTDPASNVAQVFGQSIGNAITPIEAVTGLCAIEIDPAAAAEAYRERILAPVRPLLPASEIAAITEQLSGSCTTEIASFNEFTGLLADPAQTSGFDHIIFDTAPTGHTIRLLQLPGSWTEFLDRGKGDASCLGPMSGLERSRATYRAAVDALADPALTRLVLVARAQVPALREAARTRAELAELGIHARHLVVNAVLPEDHDGGADPLYRAIRDREQAALASMPEGLAGILVDTVPLRAINMVGLEALDALLAEEAEPARDSGDSAQPGPAPVPGASTMPADGGPAVGLGELIDDLERAGHGLIMTVGKGGVGKTTIAAAIALALAERGHRVRLTTTDPAAHVAGTLDSEVDNLTVDAIDPQEATRAYRESVMAAKGSGLDEAGRAALREDLMSPCTEEIAVFTRFGQAVEQAASQFVVMDTAPTGHTFLLMDATGSYHREVLRHLKEDQRAAATTPLMRIQDPGHTRILVVTLPETTPVLEAEGLVEDLGRAGIHPWAWIVNDSLGAAGPTEDLLVRRAATEAPLIERVAARTQRLAVVPVQLEEPVGREALEALVGAP